MKTYVVVCAAAAAALLAGCDASAPTSVKTMVLPADMKPAAAITSKTDQKDVPWADTGTNPCNGDVIDMTGKSHVVYITTLNDDGSMNISASIDSHGTGVTVGNPSKIYKVGETFKYTQTYSNKTGTYAISQTDKFVVDGPLPGDDYETLATFKATILADGTVVVTTDTFKITCK